MKNVLFRLWQDESGTTAIEYGLIATIISIIAIGSLIVIGGSVTNFFWSAQAGFTLR